MKDTSEAIHPDHAKSQDTHYTGTLMGKIKVVREHEGALLLLGERFNLGIQAGIDGVVRIKTFRGTEPNWKTTAAIINHGTADSAGITWSAADEVVEVTVGQLKLSINREHGAIDIQTGHRVIQLTSLYRNREHIGDYTARVALQPTDRIYGLGETTGFLNKRGERYTMWNSDVYAPHVPEMESLYQSIPFMTVHGEQFSYGLFLDNPGKVVFDMRKDTDAALMQTHTGEFDLYLITGPGLKDVISRYADMTGKMPIPPKWALGYHQSRYSYENEQEVMELADNFRSKEVPCDVIHLDIHYMNGYRVFTFDENRFPDPEGMLAKLREQGFHIVPIVDPGVKADPMYSVYQEGLAGNHYCRYPEGDIYTGDVWPGESTFPDFTEQQVREWWGEQQRFYTDMGIEGVWNDMNEPAIFNEMKTMDVRVMHRNEGDPKTHGELHNIYGLRMAQASYEGLKNNLDGRRPFVLTRAGYSGIQRYGAVWTGDNRSFWEHMAMAMPMIMNLGMSGVPFAGPDIGGFAHHTSGELLARWTQMGVFFPYVRNHSSLDTLHQEPWSFGERIEKICKEYIEMRYRFMPYLYHWFYQASVTGLPVMKPLLLDYPSDSTAVSITDQFLVGDSLLVAPIYRPETEWRSVYLPEGEWIDYWTGEKHEGKQHIHVHAPLEKIPLYVKAGCILLEGAVRQYMEQTVDNEVLKASIYLTGTENTIETEWYEDDGVSFDYQAGAWNKLHINVAEQAETVTIHAGYEDREYVPSIAGIQYRLVGFAAEPNQVICEGAAIPKAEQLNAGDHAWSYDRNAGVLTVQVPNEAGMRSILIMK